MQLFPKIIENSGNSRICNSALKLLPAPPTISNANARLGINNLWKSSVSRRVNMIWWISLAISLLLLCTSTADARPAAAAAGISRSIRDQSRKKFTLETNTSSDTLSLSIFSPLDILRQNMLIEIQRKRLRQAKQRQMQSNKEFLDRIGR